MSFRKASVCAMHCDVCGMQVQIAPDMGGEKNYPSLAWEKIKAEAPYTEWAHYANADVCPVCVHVMYNQVNVGKKSNPI